MSSQLELNLTQSEENAFKMTQSEEREIQIICDPTQDEISYLLQKAQNNIFMLNQEIANKEQTEIELREKIARLERQLSSLVN